MDVKNRRSVTEVAADLGVGRTTVFRYIREGRLPAVRVGSGGYRINPDDVATLITVTGEAVAAK